MNMTTIPASDAELSHLYTQRLNIEHLYEDQKYDETVSLIDSIFSSLPSNLNQQRDVLAILHCKAKSLYELERYEESWLVLVNVYNTRVTTLGEEDIDTLSTLILMCEVAVFIKEENNNPDALNTFVSIIKQRFSNPSLDYKNSFNIFKGIKGIGTVLSCLNYGELAHEIIDILYVTVKTLLGETDQFTINIIYEKISIFWCTRNLIGGLDLYKDTYNKLKISLGVADTLTLQTLVRMARYIDEALWLGTRPINAGQEDVCRICNMAYDTAVTSYGPTNIWAQIALIQKASHLAWFNEDRGWFVYRRLCEVRGEKAKPRRGNKLYGLLEELKAKLDYNLLMWH